MGWMKYNANPMGRQVGDCTVRAITCATGESWEKAYTGICLQGFLMCDMPSNNGVWGAYLRRHGFKRKMLPSSCPDDYTVEDFCNEHPEGIFLVAVSGHVVCVKDGNFYDSWDSSQENPIYYFEQESED